MRVHISDPTLVGDLIAFLRRARCTAQPEGPMIVRVGIPDNDDRRASELELDVYLHTWAAMNARAQATRIPG